MTVSIAFNLLLAVLPLLLGTISAFTNSLPVARTRLSPSSTAVYYVEQDKATGSQNDLFQDDISIPPKTASFQTTASQAEDWKEAIDELIQGMIAGTDEPKIESTSATTTTTTVEDVHYDRQEAFARALLTARLKMEQRKRYDQQEAFSRALLEARLHMEQRKKRCDPQEVVFRNLLEARLKMEQRQRRLKEISGGSSHKDLVFLFVGQYHAEHFNDIVAYAQSKLGHLCTEVVTAIGGGVIGGGQEMDLTKSPSISLLTGSLPSGANANFFQFEEGVDQAVQDILVPQSEGVEKRPPSYLVLTDPFAPLDGLLAHLEKSNSGATPVIAGGVTVPPRRRRAVPSIARNGRVLEAGSLVGVEFSGVVGLQAVVAQGCRPVGPTYVITKASGAVLTGLSGESPISRLEELTATASPQDQELIRNGELVCGLGSSGDDNIILPEQGRDGEDEDEDGMVRVEDDFLIRQIMGFQPRSGCLRVAAGGLKEGNTFRFHVRAAKSAREDMDLMIQRAKTERLFAGSSNLINSQGGPSATAGKPVAAFQFSCVARGRKFYGETNVDLKRVKELFDEDDDEEDTASPIAGFYANGEIGPVGIRTSEMAARDAEDAEKSTSSTFLHGFTTVVAMLCDYTEASTPSALEEVSASAIIVDYFDDAWA